MDGVGLAELGVAGAGEEVPGQRDVSHGVAAPARIDKPESKEGDEANQQGHRYQSPNNFMIPALSVAQLYKCRWQIELFFKWIKQNLRIKSFYGTSENAVKTQT